MQKTNKEEAGNSTLSNGYDFIRNNIEQTIEPQVRMHIDSIIRDVSSMRDTERLLFCLLLPSDPSATLASLSFSAEDLEISSSGFETSGIYGPSVGSSALHLSNQLEQSQAYTWIISHLEEDPSTCLRKDEVYDDYRIYCERHHLKVLNTADFGKVMKRAFPNVKPRRLGQRGQSRYCYGGMRKRVEVQPPSLPDITGEITGSTPSIGSDAKTTDPAVGASGAVLVDVANIVLQYVQQLLGVSFTSLYQLAQHLISNRYVNARSKHAFALIAHAANSQQHRATSPSSQSFASTFSEALQKGFPAILNKDDYSRLRQSSSSTNESLDERKLKKESSTPSTPKSTNSSTSHPAVPTSHSTPSQPAGHFDENRSTPTASSIKTEYLSPSSTPASGPQHTSSPYQQKSDSIYSSSFETGNSSSSGTAYSHPSITMMMAALAAR
ncbi:Regulatory factor X, 7 [Cichlidogyrus casuarinus]|uniref:Regulatory factor X, 7 n=1 Tax=Cichlidogyrus casuarinus TaxID=1844966 RepID=A0ABD2QRK0_9PLAT